MSKSKVYRDLCLFLISVFEKFQRQDTNCAACSRVQPREHFFFFFKQNIFPPVFSIAAVREYLRPNHFFDIIVRKENFATSRLHYVALVCKQVNTFILRTNANTRDRRVHGTDVVLTYAYTYNTYGTWNRYVLADIVRNAAHTYI